MPVMSWGHEQYWDLLSTKGPGPPGKPVFGYPAWQAAVIGMGFGGLQDRWDRAVALVQWLWALLRLFWIWPVEQRPLAVRWMRWLTTADTERRAVLERMGTLLDSPAYGCAQRAVREVATTLDFNRPEMWLPYSRLIKSEPGRAQNLYRHTKACLLTDQYVREQGSTLTNPEQNFVVELAYQGFAAMGR